MCNIQKAIIEIDLPVSCRTCLLSCTYTDINENEKRICGYGNYEVTEYTYCRHADCPLKTHEHIGYDDYIRIGNEFDALRLLDEMIEKCNMKPRPDYTDMEKKLWEVGTLNHSYFLPRLEVLKDALERNII